MKKCPACNRRYADETISFCLDDDTPLSAPFDPDVTRVPLWDQVFSVAGHETPALPIVLVPSDSALFKQQLLQSRLAEIVITYNDGRVETKLWRAANFNADSNLIGNLRSRPQFRSGRWQAKGIARVKVSVIASA